MAAAPSLSDIFERKIASDSYRYSTALRSKDGKWVEVALRQFLADTVRFTSGTSMPSRGLTPQQIDEVVATLKRLDEAAQPP
jgi:cytochrome c2